MDAWMYALFSLPVRRPKIALSYEGTRPAIYIKWIEHPDTALLGAMNGEKKREEGFDRTTIETKRRKKNLNPLLRSI